MTFFEARKLARMSIKDIARLLNLSISTVKKYEKTDKAPRSVILCLMQIGGAVPEFGLRNDFSAWSFGSGFLWSPGGDKFTSGDILAIRVERELIRTLEIENKLLKIKVEQEVINGRSNVIPFPVRNRRQGDAA